MKTYKLFREKNKKLYPLFVLTNKEIPIGEEMKAEIGPLKDEGHVKSKLGALALRPGFHSCEIPFTDWIGERASDGSLLQRSDTVWCECEVTGKQIYTTERYGLKTIPNGWYYLKLNSKQKQPWIISDNITVKRKLSHTEVKSICEANGIKAQRVKI